MDDRGLYAAGQVWLEKHDVVGRARGVLPYVGMITIYMNEYPNFKVMFGNLSNNELLINISLLVIVRHSGVVSVLCASSS